MPKMYKYSAWAMLEMAKIRLIDQTREQPDGCAYFVGNKAKGYGKIQTPDGFSTMAHRFAYEVAVGPVPEGMTLDHTCHSEAVKRGECEGGDDCPHRSCVNVEHLEVVTQAEQNRRRVWKKKTACNHGHDLTGANLGVNKRGVRYCKRCAVEAQRRLRARKAAA